ncbi:pentapeptide repeat-containing protein [Streptomyces zaomyceticus]|uniref:pentapeptide repeat-containing protein n=1 Tax=Streptomyces zaomyceticus TaxID=68286 RepID=UPI003251C3D0
MAPSADIDHRGTTFTEDLLGELLNSLRDPATQLPHFGTAHFEEAQFTGRSSFRQVRFTGSAMFRSAQFTALTSFDGAQFAGTAVFATAQFTAATSFGETQFAGGAEFIRACFRNGVWFGKAHFAGSTGFTGAEFAGEAGFGGALFATKSNFTKAHFSGEAIFAGAHFVGSAKFARTQFVGRARFLHVRFASDVTFEEAQYANETFFGGAQFTGSVSFRGARFDGDARFSRAQFSDNAIFTKAEFTGDSRFGAAHFNGDARFDDAQFLVARRFGPLVCAGTLSLSGAVFRVPTTLEVAAKAVRCVRTRWESTATMRLRHAAVDFSYAVLVAPVAVTAHPAPFTLGNAVDESLLAGSTGVRVTSVQGVDATHLVLTDIDLSECLFSGAFHLDQLRLEGHTTLASTPTGWHRKGIVPVRWTRRRTLAEEQHWRAQTAGQPSAPASTPPELCRWRTGPHHPDHARTPDPDDIAPLYRQLRKAFEDGKNEPGAADFYYGECEMRRHDRNGTPKAERRLLWAYWLLSGYGLRAGRALGWLAAAMLATIVLLMAFGLPTSSPKQEATGAVPAGRGTVTFIIDKQDVKNPTGDRFTSKRFDKALNVTLNSVIFRSSGQDLTTTGTYIEMTSRILEPALLALAVLAVRGRIKR